MFHYFLIKSLSFPYKCFSLPSVSFVSLFSFGQRTESCSFVSFLERRRAESGLLGDEHVLPGFIEKGREKGFETLIHGPLSLLFRHFLLIANISTRRIRHLNRAEILLGDKSTTPDILSLYRFSHCSDTESAPDLYEAFRPAITFWWHSKQIQYRSSISHSDKSMPGNNGRAITSNQFTHFSCS